MRVIIITDIFGMTAAANSLESDLLANNLSAYSEL
jgi:hypothetical protein